MVSSKTLYIEWQPSDTPFYGNLCWAGTYGRFAECIRLPARANQYMRLDAALAAGGDITGHRPVLIHDDTVIAM